MQQLIDWFLINHGETLMIVVLFLAIALIVWLPELLRQERDWDKKDRDAMK